MSRSIAILGKAFTTVQTDKVPDLKMDRSIVHSKRVAAFEDFVTNWTYGAFFSRY